MHTINDVHQQFAAYFGHPALKPYLYVLSRKMSEGHICIHVDQLDEEELPEAIASLPRHLPKEATELVGEGYSDPKPFILYDNKLYFQRYFRYETDLINQISSRCRTSYSAPYDATISENELNAVQKYLAPGVPTEIDWQAIAAISAVRNRFTIITGGPGTGKTTTVAKVLAILYTLHPNLEVKLAAPTGKAAARMAESLARTPIHLPETLRTKYSQLQPVTLHRLLGWQKNSPYFRHDRNNPIVADLIVVDESSMIDVAMFAKLLDAIGPETKVILLGDKDQLASVEAGSLFGDLCRAQRPNTFSRERMEWINQILPAGSATLTALNVAASAHILTDHVIELKKSHRFDSSKGIGQLSKAVIENDTPVLEELFVGQKYPDINIDETYDTGALEKFVEGYQRYIEQQDIALALQELNQLRVLCAVREGDQGVRQLNMKIENSLFKKNILKRGDDSIFYTNRPIMVTRNNYALGLFNGDIGILRPDANGVMKAWFTDASEANASKVKSVLPGFINHMETVFAMTIHKSQGSEFDEVWIILPRAANTAMLSRELLYTGITRAKTKVYIQASRDTLLNSCKLQVQRGSGVVERINALTDSR
jgi:exodeoxyribonuclease V alpha subunit